MSFKNTISLTTTDDVTSQIRADTQSPQETAIRIANYLEKAALGTAFLSMDVQTSGQTTLVAASGTLTIASGAAADTAVVGTQTFTASASPSGNNQYLSTGSDSVQAAALAAKISAHPSLAQVVTAAAVGAVITVTASDRGQVGNMITLTGSTHITASASTLTGGVNKTATICHLGA